MELKKWKKLMGLNNRQLADLINMSPASVTLLLQGKRKPSPQKAFEIIMATDKAVTLEDLYMDGTETIKTEKEKANG